MIVLTNVTKAFGKKTALSNVSLRVNPGEFVCIAGPSGAGKTTLLSLVIAAQEATSGSVEIDGVNVRRIPSPPLQLYRRRVGMVFQDGKLLADRTVRENIAFPLEVCGVADAVIKKRVDDVMKKLEILGNADAFPHELSAGENMRTAIARAIVHRPLIILADEPTGNLDPVQAAAILELLRAIHREGTTVILATHDASITERFPMRVIRLEEGKAMPDGTAAPAKKTIPKPATSPLKHEFFAENRASMRESPLPGSDLGGTFDTVQRRRKIKITSIGP
ncbi:ATP-binding cassette domain-containing protein [Candidatus Peregrinibacteria bacterium]|nr:ATP-binding cassette domain-containing protein [Candidatus Peregrinibacteria bacterium]MBI3816724.1 ATP-binding cassette domain-containing protein [Candidatus Peregrinibacteria bacterium]